MNTLHRFKSFLSCDMSKFLQYKRALKRKYITEEAVLRLLDYFLVEQCVESFSSITPQTIEAFLASRPRYQPRSYNHLLGVTRCFFGWLVIQERLDTSPVRASSRQTTAQKKPFLFDLNLAKRLLSLSAALPNRSKGPDRGIIYHLVFAMMYSLGLRVGEVSRLCNKDVDLKRQLLEIRATKFAKDRLVPFGPRLGQQLENYLNHKKCRSDKLSPDAPLFSFNAGRPIHPGTISQTFHHLVSENSFTPLPGTSAPKLHCLRHSFAVGTLLRWYREGIDPGQRLIHLSTFMGHVNPDSTAWYLTITDELLAEASQRFEKFSLPAIGRTRS